MKIKIVHTNDLHGKLTDELAQKIASLRKESDFYFDTGDAINAGNLAIPVKPEKAWGLLELAHCDASTIGNRETHLSKAAFARKIEGAQHPLLCCNMVDSKTKELILPASKIFTVNDIKVGVIGVSIPMVTETMMSRAASAYLWNPPQPSLEIAISEIKDRVDVIFVLSHLGLTTDKKLAASVSGIDVIFGGHSHSVLEVPERIENTWIAQGGSHARFMGLYEFDSETRILTGRLAPLKSAT